MNAVYSWRNYMPFIGNAGYLKTEKFVVELVILSTVSLNFFIHLYDPTERIMQERFETAETISGIAQIWLPAHGDHFGSEQEDRHNQNLTRISCHYMNRHVYIQMDGNR